AVAGLADETRGHALSAQRAENRVDRRPLLLFGPTPATAEELRRILDRARAAILAALAFRRDRRQESERCTRSRGMAGKLRPDEGLAGKEVAAAAKARHPSLHALRLVRERA